MEKIRILALSGSLREKSYNTLLIKTVIELAPEGIEIIEFDSMAHMPLFNPDEDNTNNTAITALRRELKKADGLIISSPEYAHGISGVLKNALDWLVSGDAFPSIPVALYNTSPRATHALAALREVILTMSGIIIESASITVPLLGIERDVNSLVQDNEISRYIIHKTRVFRDEILKSSRKNKTH
jgi:NAD(P)H-dependent FMN reductase